MREIFHKPKCVFVLVLVRYIQGNTDEMNSKEEKHSLCPSLIIISLFSVCLFFSVLAWAHTVKIRTNSEIVLHHTEGEISHFLNSDCKHTHTKSCEDQNWS